MAEPLIFVNTYQLKRGKLDAYRGAATEWFAWNGPAHPRLLHHQVYADEGGVEVTNIQVHPDSDSLEQQMRLVADRHGQWQEHVDWSTMSIRLFGTPSDVVLKELRQIAGSGVPVTVSAPIEGFSRLPATP